MLQQHFQRIQGRRRVLAFQVEIQPVDQIDILAPVDAQGNAGRKGVPMIIGGIVAYAHILQAAGVRGILRAQCLCIGLVRVGARAGLFAFTVCRWNQAVNLAAGDVLPLVDVLEVFLAILEPVADGS